MHPINITIQTIVSADPETCWHYYITPEHIMGWNFASPDWFCPSAINDLRPGGQLNWRMEAKDGSFGFNFAGTYSDIVPLSTINYTIEDGRPVMVSFEPFGQDTRIILTFQAETINDPELQREGWLAILTRFKHYTESHPVNH